MKDFFGQDLSIGDQVAFTEPHYRNMVPGKITKFTTQFIMIEWNRNYNNTLGNSKPFLKTFRATSLQVIKKP